MSCRSRFTIFMLLTTMSAFPACAEETAAAVVPMVTPLEARAISTMGKFEDAVEQLAKAEAAETGMTLRRRTRLRLSELMLRVSRLEGEARDAYQAANGAAPPPEMFNSRKRGHTAPGSAAVVGPSVLAGGQQQRGLNSFAAITVARKPKQRPTQQASDQEGGLAGAQLLTSRQARMLEPRLGHIRPEHMTHTTDPRLPPKKLEGVTQGHTEGECLCDRYWAKCNSGWGEHGENGCGNSKGKSCADICSPGEELPWKPLYRATVAKEAELEAQCPQDPTAKFGGKRQESNGGPFAVCFSGGMRNFVAVWHSWKANLVEPSGNDVDVYFHVWRDENTHAGSPLSERSRDLALSLPHTKGYVEEKFTDHLALLHKQEPSINYGQAIGNRSWLWALEEAFPPGGRKMSPYVFGPGFSQFRKVHLCHEMVRESGRPYSIVIRARPDHIFLAPMDLRHFALSFAGRPSVKRAKGHFVAVPERHQGQQVSDHFWMGTLQAMLELASKPLPYTLACCEGYVQRNLDLRCFERSEAMVDEDFGMKGHKKVSEAMQSSTQQNSLGWSPVPDTLRTHLYAPRVNNAHASNTYGDPKCKRVGSRERGRGGGAYGIGRKGDASSGVGAAAVGGGGAGGGGASSSGSGEEEEGGGGYCIPAHRTGLTYIYNIVTSAWLATGAMCIGRYAGKDEAQFLLHSGFANATLEKVAKKFGFGPCLQVPTLEKAWHETRRYLDELDDKDRTNLLAHNGR